MATRRASLAGLASAALPRVGWAEVGNPVCLAAGKVGDAFVLHGLTAAGESVFDIDLPARGHAAAAHPSQALAVAFARRPGTYALVVDCLTGQVRHSLIPPRGRQFNGHGVFSADGSLLMTSEVVAEGSAGRIGVWDSADFRRIGEWDSGGIGPHDLKRLADGSLVVANGGIRTDPADRTKLNLSEMHPNISRISSQGQIIDQVTLADDLRQNSIRHLAVMGDTVAFAMQWEGDSSQAVPQLGLWTPGNAPQLCPPRDADAMAMKGYAGSIAVAPTGDLIAVTSSVGGVLMLFDAAGQHIATHQRADISGIAALPVGLVGTDGHGGFWLVARENLTLLSHSKTSWDNHLIAIA